MSRRRAVEQRCRGLGDVRDILAAVRSLALIETHKLEPRLAHHAGLLATLDHAATAFLASHPYPDDTTDDATPVRIVVGSERGLCGDYNGRLTAEITEGTHRLIVVGRRLADELDGALSPVAALPGAHVAEEAPTVANAIVEALGALQGANARPTRVSVLHWSHEAGGPVTTALLPPFTELDVSATDPRVPPLYNLTPLAFFRGLIDLYLPLTLEWAVTTALMAENQGRARHLDGAVHHVDERLEDLRRRAHQLRQEEIIEEIEVILLSAGLPADGAAPGGP